MRLPRLHFFLLIAVILAPTTVWATSVNKYLATGELTAGITDYGSRLEQSNATDGDRFSLAALTFFNSIEGLAQAFYRTGLDSRVGRRANIPFLRLPIPPNPDPQTVTGKEIRIILEAFEAGLKETNSILVGLKGESFNVPIAIGHIRMDLDGNGLAEERESFHGMYTTYNRRARQHFRDDHPVTVHFDQADAHWLKGYTHLLMALTNFFLAHDGSRVFEHAGHAFFPNAKTEHGALFRQQKAKKFAAWADLIAGVHVMHMEVKSRKRLKAAHAHLLKMIDASRQTWRLIQAESDDVNEWLPNPAQTSVTGVKFSAEMITGWQAVLDEFEGILEGRKLIPHWRITDGRGINLKRVLLEPRPFDLVLWLQGAAAIPYLEAGDLSSKQTWRRLSRVFQGDFIGFALWIN